MTIETRDRIFVKDYEFLFFAKNTNKNIGKNISRNLGSKYSQKLFHHSKKVVTDAIKTACFKKSNSKITNKITKNSSQKNSKTDSQTKEKSSYISPE